MDFLTDFTRVSLDVHLFPRLSMSFRNHFAWSSTSCTYRLRKVPKAMCRMPRAKLSTLRRSRSLISSSPSRRSARQPSCCVLKEDAFTSTWQGRETESPWCLLRDGRSQGLRGRAGKSYSRTSCSSSRAAKDQAVPEKSVPSNWLILTSKP